MTEKIILSYSLISKRIENLQLKYSAHFSNNFFNKMVLMEAKKKYLEKMGEIRSQELGNLSIKKKKRNTQNPDY